MNSSNGTITKHSMRDSKLMTLNIKIQVNSRLLIFRFTIALYSAHDIFAVQKQTEFKYFYQF